MPRPTSFNCSLGIFIPTPPTLRKNAMIEIGSFRGSHSLRASQIAETLITLKVYMDNSRFSLQKLCRKIHFHWTKNHLFDDWLRIKQQAEGQHEKNAKTRILLPAPNLSSLAKCHPIKRAKKQSKKLQSCSRQLAMRWLVPRWP